VFEKLSAGKTFTPGQQAWLDRIRAHLVVSLSIEKDDFELIGVLARWRVGRGEQGVRWEAR
jgi:hypothetical protein